jgi:hypothetical protein
MDTADSVGRPQGTPLQDRWRHYASDEWKPMMRHSSAHEVWQLIDSEYRHQVVRRGGFFDAEKGGIVIDRFTELEPALRCCEASAKRPRRKRKGTPKPP